MSKNDTLSKKNSHQESQKGGLSKNLKTSVKIFLYVRVRVKPILKKFRVLNSRNSRDVKK